MNDSERTWRRRATQITRRANTGWFFQKISPILIGGGVLFAILVLCLRTLKPDLFNPMWMGIAGGVALLIAVLTALALSRKHFIDRREGLVRLEDRLSLNNSLSSADDGVGPWPGRKVESEDMKLAGLNWNMPAVILPLLTVLILVAGSILVPIPSLNAAAKNLPPNEPGAWNQMEEWLEALEEENLIDEDALKEVAEKIDELRDQPEDEWFSHSSMEATDSMRDALGRDLQEAARDLATLERDLAALQNYSGQMSEEAREMLMKEYDEALKNLGLNSTQLNKELLKELKDMDLSQLSQQQMDQLTQEQLQQLREKLKSGCQ